jgi:hypothetical protein
MWRKHNDCSQDDSVDTALNVPVMSANGTFEVDLQPQEDDGFPAGRMLIEKKYTGDMKGSGTGALEGISGSMRITQDENGHSYELAYEF